MQFTPTVHNWLSATSKTYKVLFQPTVRTLRSLYSMSIADICKLKCVIILTPRNPLSCVYQFTQIKSIMNCLSLEPSEAQNTETFGVSWIRFGLWLNTLNRKLLCEWWIQVRVVLLHWVQHTNPCLIRMICSKAAWTSSSMWPWKTSDQCLFLDKYDFRIHNTVQVNG